MNHRPAVHQKLRWYTHKRLQEEEVLDTTGTGSPAPIISDCDLFAKEFTYISEAENIIYTIPHLE